MDVPPPQCDHIESAFRLLLEGAPDAILVTDRRGRIVLANAIAARTFGYPREELLALCVEDLVPARLRARHVEDRERYQRDPHPRYMAERRSLTAARRGGSELQVEIIGLPAFAQRAATAARLDELHALGVAVLVENFGSHTWALTDLGRLKIDALSLEQLLVARVSEEPEAALIGSLVALGHSLRLKVLGKGVETPLQADRLRAHGCDAALGHHLAPPLPAPTALAWLQAHGHPPTVHLGR